MSATATAPRPGEAPHPFDDAPVVHRYTRADGIRDGMLIDVTETGREAGFSVPVAITGAVQDQCVRWTEEDTRRKPRVYQDEDGRLWDVLWMAACRSREIARSGRQASTTLFQVIVVPRPGNGRQRLRTLKLVIGPGDAGEAVATIMLPDES
ncbi:MAG: hypothetical protein OXQ28_00645 [Acidobacteriota bacterium]|nr:hypothetical protein [Acidobacteriota bacterium]